MTHVWLAAAAALLLTIAAGLLFVVRAASRTDALLAALLFGTTGVAAVLALAKGLAIRRGVDLALVLALLAAILAVAFVRRGWPEGEREEGE